MQDFRHVQSIGASRSAFAATTADGKVATWQKMDSQKGAPSKRLVQIPKDIHNVGMFFSVP